MKPVELPNDRHFECIEDVHCEDLRVLCSWVRCNYWGTKCPELSSDHTSKVMGMVKNSLLDPALDSDHVNAAIARRGQGKKNKKQH